jgi:hypothetical protein
MRKTITITDFLTDAEIQQAQKRYRAMAGTGRFAATFAADVIRPNLPRINAALGQENDAMYLAYAVEYVLGLAK